MGARQFTFQPRAISDGGTILPGARIEFTEVVSGANLPVYATANLDTPLPNPLIADAAGRFTPLWIDDDLEYRARLIDAYGNEIWEVSPLEIFPGTLSGIPLDDAGRPMPGSRLEFYRSATNTLTPIYGDVDLLVELDNPLTADENGEFPPIYIDEDRQYRVRLLDGNGALIHDIDEYQVLVTITVPPSPPTLAGSIDSLTASLEWNEATAGTAPIAEYWLYRSASGGSFVRIAQIDTADPREYDDAGLSEDVIYRYYVTALDENAVESSASNVIELVESSAVFPVSDWINPGAEMTDLTGWTVTTGSFITMNDRFPPVGSWIFRGGATPSAKMFQRFELDGIGVPLTAVDAGNTKLIVDWWGGTFIQTPADQPAINMIFRDAALSIISTATSGYKNPSTQYGANIRWDQYQEVQTIPPLCRYIDIELEAKRNNGTNNDAAFDAVLPHVELIA